MLLPEPIAMAIDEAIKMVYSYQPLAEKTLILGEQLTLRWSCLVERITAT